MERCEKCWKETEILWGSTDGLLCEECLWAGPFVAYRTQGAKGNREPVVRGGDIYYEWAPDEDHPDSDTGPKP